MTNILNIKVTRKFAQQIWNSYSNITHTTKQYGSTVVYTYEMKNDRQAIVTVDKFADTLTINIYNSQELMARYTTIGA